MEFFIAIVLMVIMGIIPVLTFVDFLSLLFSRERVFKGLKNVLPLVMLAPIAVMFLDLGVKNDCCGDSAIFSPEHRLSTTVLILICVAAFFYSAYRKRLAPPLMEVIANCFLIIGVVMDLLVGLQLREAECWYFGIIPVAGQFLLVLMENHFMAINSLNDAEAPAENGFIKVCRRIVFSPAWQKIPLLILLCLPLLIVLVAVLLLFGQRPDSLVRAFTDTYKHGFSKLDYQCAGVVCDGIHHYYGVFDKAWVSNTIYILMKPLEWLFVIILYLGDRDPETRIAQQYLHRDHRDLLRQPRSPRPSRH